MQACGHCKALLTPGASDCARCGAVVNASGRVTHAPPAQPAPLSPGRASWWAIALLVVWSIELMLFFVPFIVADLLPDCTLGKVTRCGDLGPVLEGSVGLAFDFLFFLMPATSLWILIIAWLCLREMAESRDSSR